MTTLTQPNPTVPPAVSPPPPRPSPPRRRAVYWGDWLGAWIWIVCAALILAKCAWGWVLTFFE